MFGCELRIDRVNVVPERVEPTMKIGERPSKTSSSRYIAGVTPQGNVDQATKGGRPSSDNLQPPMAARQPAVCEAGCGANLARFGAGCNRAAGFAKPV